MFICVHADKHIKKEVHMSVHMWSLCLNKLVCMGVYIFLYPHLSLSLYIYMFVDLYT